MKPLVLLIFAIAAEFNVPRDFALAITVQDNSELCAEYWEHPEERIREEMEQIKWLIDRPEVQTFWDVAIAYNAGLNALEDPPPYAIEYANRVMFEWNDLSRGKIEITIRTTN